MAQPLVQFSEVETHLFGIKVGRANLTQFEPKGLLEDLLREKYDVVRLHHSSADRLLEVKLRAMKIPFSLCGIVPKFWICHKAFEFKPMTNAKIEFIPYAIKDRSDLEQMIEICFYEQVTGFFEIPVFSAKVPKVLQHKAFSRFLLDQLDRNPAEYLAWTVYLEGQPAGFLINTFGDRVTETILAGVLPKFSNQKIFRDIARFSQNFGKQNGRSGYTGARIQNVLSQNLFADEGMTVRGSNLVYYLIPLFGLQFESDRWIHKSAEADSITVLKDHLNHHYPIFEILSIKYTCFKQTPSSR